MDTNPMLVAHLSRSIEAPWTSMTPIQVGGFPNRLGSPDRYVTVSAGDEPLRRIDVFQHSPDSLAFEEVCIWHDNVVVGFGSHVHLVSLANTSCVSLELESYFGHLYPTEGYLLVASGERLFRIAPDRRVEWKSDVLGIDGVIVDETGPPMIRGEGEWDPPGGWRPFTLLAESGENAR